MKDVSSGGLVTGEAGLEIVPGGERVLSLEDWNRYLKEVGGVKAEKGEMFHIFIDTGDIIINAQQAMRLEDAIQNGRFWFEDVPVNYRPS